MPTSGDDVERVVVRPMGRDDAAFAAELHHVALPHGFFARLGPGFLRGYYRSFVLSPHALALLAEVDGQPAGALVGTTDDAAHYRHVLRTRGWELAASGAGALLRRPPLLRWFLRHRARRYLAGAARLVRGSARRPRRRAPVAAERSGHLTHVAVADGHRGAGVGAALVAAYTEGARRAGSDVLVVVTRSGPDSRARFYQRCGWHPWGTSRDLDGVPFDRLRLPLDRAA